MTAFFLITTILGMLMTTASHISQNASAGLKARLQQNLSKVQELYDKYKSNPYAANEILSEVEKIKQEADILQSEVENRTADSPAYGADKAEQLRKEMTENVQKAADKSVKRNQNRVKQEFDPMMKSNRELYSKSSITGKEIK